MKNVSELSEKDIDKIVASIARFLAGLKPKSVKYKNRSHKHYFERFKFAKIFLRKIINYRGTNICPFCKKKLRSKAAYTYHITTHRNEIKMELESINAMYNKIKRNNHSPI